MASVLRRLGVAHFVTGSTATIAYGEPRLTNDIDIVVDLRAGHVEPLLSAFSGAEFYLSEETVWRAVSKRSSFNLIHPASGLKVDFMVAEDSAFNRSRFRRARELEIGLDAPVLFASPEDVILKKLEYYRMGASEKHLRDIAGVLRTTDELDEPYLEYWAELLGVKDAWEKAKHLR